MLSQVAGIVARVETLRGPQMCRVIGATYRQLDYWARTGVLVPAVPAAGSGSQRRYSVRQALDGRACAVLADVRCGGKMLGPAVHALALLRVDEWTGRVVVCQDGTVRRPDAWLGEAAAILDLDAIRAHVALGLTDLPESGRLAALVA